ncbi:hypothetical protein C0992_010676 [Termitomyces sp. T32_za158]|nr:hypothetical protein C0992_010676 [Termitomyces sp. T32_za158]
MWGVAVEEPVVDETEQENHDEFHEATEEQKEAVASREDEGQREELEHYEKVPAKNPHSEDDEYQGQDDH